MGCRTLSCCCGSISLETGCKIIAAIGLVWGILHPVVGSIESGTGPGLILAGRGILIVIASAVLFLGVT